MEENKKKLDTSISDDLQPFHNDLLELVQKNKLIPSFLNELAPDDPNLLCLKEAICKANFQVLIWDNPQCDLYLIYLIQKKMIPFWQGITAYVYLIAKMQYTTTQKLRVEDEDVKFNYQVNMVSLVEAGKLTELGGQYLFGVIHALEKLKIYFNLSQVVTFVLNLPPIEQCLIKTEFNHHLFESEKGGNHSADQLIWILLNNIPLIQKIPTDFSEPTTPYLVPSSSLINYFLQAVNEQPMRMRPVFGNPGLKTLYQWHAQNVHPVALYTPHIISNPKDADGYRCGPFPMWFHDIGHVFWTSLLLKLNRDSIFTVFIPALRALKKIAETYRDKLSITYLEEVERKAYDFDLTPVSNYADITTRFSIYIAHTFGKNPNYGSCLYRNL